MFLYLMYFDLSVNVCMFEILYDYDINSASVIVNLISGDMGFYVLNHLHSQELHQSVYL